jgi:hypothetical protein
MNKHIFEATMMICFSVSWVFSLIRSARSRSTAGKSVAFLWIILVGYLAGIAHKLFVFRDWVLWLYTANGVMVVADLALYYRNRLDERACRKSV